MVPWIAIIALANQPPVVGRPVDFSGAVGGPFVVQWHAEPTTVTVEEPITLTLRITGSGNLRKMPWPSIAKLNSFKHFAVEDLDDRFTDANPPTREFRYRVRPRTADVKEIPRFKLVYFNPQAVSASRGYQTTYAEALPLTVNQRPGSPADIPADVPAWMLREPAWDEVFPQEPSLIDQWLWKFLDWLGIRHETPGRRGMLVWPLRLATLLLPPLICAGWLVLWRKWNPDAARLATSRRSRAASAAIRVLHAATDEPGAQVATALIAYFHSRADMPPALSTPAEVGQWLSERGCSNAQVAAATNLLQRCDEARFAPSRSVSTTLIGDAERAILQWETESWSPLGS
jgi:hypothetical protein